ncbi:MAG: nuclease, partial [Eubacteriales bacterium]|nr:nuclease [Eubacteriales bacterium]
MDYVEIGKIPPRSKSVMSTPEELVDRLQSLVGTKMQLTGKSRTDGSNFRKLVTEHLLSKYIPEAATEYEIVPPKQKGVP